MFPVGLPEAIGGEEGAESPGGSGIEREGRSGLLDGVDSREQKRQKTRIAKRRKDQGGGRDWLNCFIEHRYQVASTNPKQLLEKSLMRLSYTQRRLANRDAPSLTMLSFGGNQPKGSAGAESSALKLSQELRQFVMSVN